MAERADDSLSVFEQCIREFIVKSKYNLELCGVAKCFPLSENFFSSSFSVIGDGPLPTPSKCNLVDAAAFFQRIVPKDCTFKELVAVKFITADGTIGRRWQVHYSFRPYI